MIVYIVATIAGILGGFGVVKNDDDPDADPENDGLIKSLIKRIKD